MSNLTSSFPPWWDTSITIFNKFTDPQTQVIKWYSTTLDNCFWKYTGDKVTIGQTVLETDNTICRIPYNELFTEKYLWIKIPNDKKHNNFTLGVGDIIVKGSIDDEIDEYKNGKRSSDFVEKYKNQQGCMTIEEVAINVGTGRGQEHYYVKGV